MRRRDGYDVTLRPPLSQVAIRELQDAGVEPDVWKLEGYDGSKTRLGDQGAAN